ncbi:MAG: histidine kinase dimerization/phosphoacceptor domain -containing protein [Sphingorhabdus sp.]
MTRLPDHADNMAIALISSSFAPLLLLNDNLKVIAASASFCRAFELDVHEVKGRKINDLGKGEWNVRQLEALLKATVAGKASIDIYEMDLVREGRDTRRLLINAHTLDYFEAENIRIVLAVTDVTSERHAERIKDELIRDKQLLLQEIQHRVANSLQIIASVLLQSARKVQSSETRDHLRDAHSRVMSIATLQKHLAATTVHDVSLNTYFNDLCMSIGASMIGDPEKLTLRTEIDDSIVDPDMSVSLGLIVTELVINSLKHAFPGGDKAGSITVSYKSEGTGWTLEVADNGIGMAKTAEDRKPGLGTGIVEALAGQLKASVTITDAAPGTRVSVTHVDEA